jgi:AcrR family transcriptional regulator
MTETPAPLRPGPPGRVGRPGRPAGPARRPAEETWRLIQDAAIRLFATKGFAAVGIREIAHEAGISTAALYHYMSTKDDLLTAIMRQALQEFLDDARRALAGITQPSHQIDALVHHHVVSHGRNPLRARVVDNEVRTLTVASAREILQLRDQYQDLWREAIEAGAAKRLFRVTDPHLATLALLEMCNGLARWYDPRGPLSLEEISSRFSEMALQLLGARAAAIRALPGARTTSVARMPS